MVCKRSLLCVLREGLASSSKNVMLISSHKAGLVYALKPFYSYLTRMPACVLTSAPYGVPHSTMGADRGATCSPVDFSLTAHDEKKREDITQSLSLFPKLFLLMFHFNE